MSNHYLKDIGFLSNGGGKAVYGGRLDANFFNDVSAIELFDEFAKEVISAIGKTYYPVYRMADGELHFLFGFRINWRNMPVRNIFRYVKYGLLGLPRKTSWAESYPARRRAELRQLLSNCVFKIAQNGKLAVYWNENGLHAFTEYNRVMERSFARIAVKLCHENYVPFHFCQALLVKHARSLLHNKKVLIVSGMPENEFSALQNNLLDFGSAHVELLKCSKTSALMADYTSYALNVMPELVLVAAGIGAAKVLADLEYLNCPILDIGSFIHLMSGTAEECHAGFFKRPFID